MKKNFIRIIFALALVFTMFGIHIANNVNAEEPIAIGAAEITDLTFKVKVKWEAEQKDAETTLKLMRKDNGEVLERKTVTGDSDFITFKPVPSTENGEDITEQYIIKQDGVSSSSSIYLNGLKFDYKVVDVSDDRAEVPNKEANTKYFKITNTEMLTFKFRNDWSKSVNRIDTTAILKLEDSMEVIESITISGSRSDEERWWSFRDVPRFINGEDMSDKYKIVPDRIIETIITFSPREKTEIIGDYDYRFIVKSEEVTDNKAVVPNAEKNTRYFHFVNSEIKKMIVEKLWRGVDIPEDDNVDHGFSPSPVVSVLNENLRLIAPRKINVSVFGDGVDTGKNIELQGPNYSSYTDYLPIFNNNGEKIKYTLKEIDSKGNKVGGGEKAYFDLINSNGENFRNTEFFVKEELITETVGTNLYDKLVITNSYGKPDESERINIKVTKKWVNPKSQSMIYAQLYVNGEETNKSVYLSDYNNWTNEFKHLPTLDENGNKIEYTVKEQGEKNGIVFIGYEDDEYKVNVAGNVKDGFEITNTLNTDYAKTTMNLNVNWIDKAHFEDELRIAITDNGYFSGKYITLKAPDWKISLDDLREINRFGEKADYGFRVVDYRNAHLTTNEVSKLSRENENRYRVNYIKKGNVFDINITYIAPEVELKEISIYKEWEGVYAPQPYPTSLNFGNGEENETLHRLTRDTNVQVELIENGVPTGEIIDINFNTFWSASFPYLYAKDKEGKNIDYTIREVGAKDGFIEIDGRIYEVKIEKISDTDFKITNIYKNQAEPKVPSNPVVTEDDTTYDNPKTDVKITKEWIGEDVKKEVEIVLYANGEKTDKSVKLNEQNSWTYVFKDLDSLKGGKTIVYTVKEVGEVDGTLEAGESKYKVEYLGNQKEGFVVKNSRIDEVIDLTDNTSKEKTSNIEKKQNSIPKTAVARTSFLTFVASISGAVVLKKLKKED